MPETSCIVSTRPQVKIFLVYIKPLRYFSIQSIMSFCINVWELSFIHYHYYILSIFFHHHKRLAALSLRMFPLLIKRVKIIPTPETNTTLRVFAMALEVLLI